MILLSCLISKLHETKLRWIKYQSANVEFKYSGVETSVLWGGAGDQAPEHGEDEGRAHSSQRRKWPDVLPGPLRAVEQLEVRGLGFLGSL